MNDPQVPTAATPSAAPIRAQLTPSPSERWIFLGIVSAGLFLVGVDNSVLYTALPVLRQELHASELEALWIINAYPLVLSGLLLGTGTLGDRIGHRRMFLFGLIIFGLASIAAAFSPHAWALVSARAMLGLGAATMLPATLALIRETFRNPRELSTAIGIWAATATFGAAAGPVVGGLLLEHYWWGSIFLINIPVVVLALIGTVAIAPPNSASPEKHWDFRSSFYAMIAMLGTVMLIKEIAGARSQVVILGAIVFAIAGALLFGYRQKHLREPLLSFDIFRSRMFTGGVLAAGLAMFVLAGTELMTTQRFQLAAGYTPLQAGLLASLAAVISFPFSIAGGVIVHRVGFRTLITGGFSVATLGLAAMGIGQATESMYWLVPGLMALGAGSGAVMSVSSTAIIGSAPASRAGMASAVEAVSYEFGTLLTVAITGSLFPMFFARYAAVDPSLSMYEVLADPAAAPTATTGIDAAYLTVLWILTAVGVIAAIYTAYAFRGNPKETRYAHE